MEGIALKIIALETIQVAEYRNLVWVEMHTVQGLVGLGETFRNPDIHETARPVCSARTGFRSSATPML